jgi:sugar phosphate permease
LTASSTTEGEGESGSRQDRVVQFCSPYLFYGWVIVAMGFIAQIFTSFSAQGLSTYIGPLQREFGWSAATTAAGRSFQQVDTFLGPLNGWLVDRFGPRVLMSVGVVLFAFAFLVFSWIDSLWSYYAACLLMALANSLVGLLVVSFSLNRWFRRRRSMAMGLAVTGFAIAGAIFIPVIVWAQEVYGWRQAAFGTSIGILLLGLPIMLLMRDAPEPYGLLPDGERPGQVAATGRDQARGGGLVNFTMRQALQTRAYWQIAAATALAMLVQSAVVVHQFPYFEELLDRETAAFVLSEMNLFNIGGRLVGGMLGDRMPKHLLMALNLLFATIGMLLLSFGTTLVPFLVYGAFFGFSWGVRAAVSNALVGDYFGRVAYGRIAGLMQTIASPPALAAPVLIGLGADIFGGYQVPFLLLAVCAAIGSLLFFLASRPPDPVTVAGAV